MNAEQKEGPVLFFSLWLFLLKVEDMVSQREVDPGSYRKKCWFSFCLSDIAELCFKEVPLAYWASIKSEKKKHPIQFHTTCLLRFSKFAGWTKVAQNKQNIKPLKPRLLTNTYMVSSTVEIIHTFFSPAQFSLSRKGGTYIFEDLAGFVMWIIYTSQNELCFCFFLNRQLELMHENYPNEVFLKIVLIT